MATGLTNELIALNAIRRVYANNGFPKTASVRLAIRTLHNMKALAEMEKKAAGGEDPGYLEELGAGVGSFFPEDRAARFATYGGLSGGALGAAYDQFRPREMWEDDPSLFSTLESAGKGGLLGAGAGGLYGYATRPHPLGDRGDFSASSEKPWENPDLTPEEAARLKREWEAGEVTRLTDLVAGKIQDPKSKLGEQIFRARQAGKSSEYIKNLIVKNERFQQAVGRYMNAEGLLEKHQPFSQRLATMGEDSKSTDSLMSRLGGFIQQVGGKASAPLYHSLFESSQEGNKSPYDRANAEAQRQLLQQIYEATK